MGFQLTPLLVLDHSAEYIYWYNTKEELHVVDAKEEVEDGCMVGLGKTEGRRNGLGSGRGEMGRWVRGGGGGWVRMRMWRMGGSGFGFGLLGGTTDGEDGEGDGVSAGGRGEGWGDGI
ncbi:glycine-rich RNA-binding protein 8-like [Malus domestica]|uniref:glycine-rich RNA-binding protein 8-like n=1 Tax=Malus domestica TaxID=3750 RepID=UPI00397568F6